MTKLANKGIGNIVAPWRFIMFLILFLAGTSAAFPLTDAWQKAVMIGFDGAAFTFLASLWPVINDGNASSIKRHAAANDANRVLLLVLAAVIIFILVVTIAMELSAAGSPPAVLIVITLCHAWLFSNAVFGLHYAHLFFGDGSSAGGINFPGKGEPDYWDFMYFAFTLGMTFQTSDVAITDAKIRRTVLAQTIAAFLFNIGVLAFTVNILGS